MRKIVITVEGGIVQEITGIPEGVIVEIHDYDCDPRDPDDLSINFDEDGKPYALATFSGVIEEPTA